MQHKPLTHSEHASGVSQFPHPFRERLAGEQVVPTLGLEVQFLHRLRSENVPGSLDRHYPAVVVEHLIYIQKGSTLTDYKQGSRLLSWLLQY